MKCALCKKESRKIICEACEEFLKTKSEDPVNRVKAYAKFLKQDEEFNLIKSRRKK